MKEKKTIKKMIRHTLQLKQAVMLVWKNAPGWTLINLVLVVIQGIFPLVSLYLIKKIVDTIAAGISGSDPALAFQGVIKWIILAGIVTLLTALFRSLGEHASEAQSLIVTDAVSDILHAKSIQVDLEFYEDAEYYNTMHRAQKEAPYRPNRIVTGLVDVIRSGIALTGILVLLFAFNPVLGMVLFLSACPAMLVKLRYSRLLYNYEKKHTESERKSWYYHWMMTDISHAKEIRLFDLGFLFQKRFRHFRKDLREEKLRLSRRRFSWDILAQTVTTAAVYGVFAFIGYQTVTGSISLGELIMYHQGFQKGLGFMGAVLGGLAGLYEDNLFLSNFYRFLDITPRIKIPENPKSLPLSKTSGGDILFQDVRFKYPNSQKTVLDGINLSIKPNQMVALVGKNGSGKTTLVKLLTRLYDPTGGNIRFNGTDIRELDPVAWRGRISGIFQDYNQYNLKAAENIRLGNLKQNDQKEAVKRAARFSGADAIIQSLPDSYDTILGRRFSDGYELSIGEWQKIALARAFMRDAGILILDEPSQSLDPQAEADFFSKFRDMVQERRVLIISHRFSTVKMADYIYVLSEGRIIEEGNHRQLMKENGVYAALFTTQAKNYQTS